MFTTGFTVIIIYFLNSNHLLVHRNFFALFLPADAKGNSYKFELLFTRNSISITFDYLRVPTTKSFLVTRECELEVVPTYQPIMELWNTCRLLSEEILGPTEYCRFSKGPLWGPFSGAILGGGQNLSTPAWFEFDKVEGRNLRGVKKKTLSFVSKMPRVKTWNLQGQLWTFEISSSYIVQELKIILSFSCYSAKSRWTKNCLYLFGYSTFYSWSGTGMCCYRKNIAEHLSPTDVGTP